MEKYNCNGWEYYIEEGAANIVGIPKIDSRELEVPETLDGYPVEEVKFYFANVRDYTSIRLPKTIKRFDAICVAETIEAISIDSENEHFIVKEDIIYSRDGKMLVSFPPAKKKFDISYLNGVEIIGDGAFSCCNCIENLTLPESIIGIGDYAFEGCENLESVFIPDSVINVGKAIFAYSSLKTVRLSKNIKKLEAGFGYDAEGEGFFASCDIENIILPEGLEKIGYCTFDNCKKLKEIHIPSSVIEIEDFAFHKCESLEKVTVSNDNKFYYSKNGVLYSYSGHLLLYPINKKESKFVVPVEVKVIHQYAFYKVRNLKQLVLGDSISSICYRAFACSNIESVNIPKKTESIELDVFLYCQVKELYIPRWVSYIETNSNTKGNINPYKNMTLLVEKDSYAEQICKDYKLNYSIVN